MTNENKIYWTYIYDGDLHDADYDSKNAAQAAADEWWAEYCTENHEGIRNGESFSDEVELIAWSYNEDGERKIFTTVKGTVEYEHYHGDMKEHGYP